MQIKTTLIILAHKGHNVEITEAICINALANEGKITPDTATEFVKIDVSGKQLGDNNIDFEGAAEQQRLIYERQIKPLMLANPNYTIVYFGIAPIPLIIHLGFLIGNFRKKLIYQWHHTQHFWYADIPHQESIFGIEPLKKRTKQKGRGDVILCVSASNIINEDDTKGLVDNILDEHAFTLSTFHKDAITMQSHYEKSSEQILQIFDEISNHNPKRDILHLFVASGCGLSFLVGTLINPNITPNVQLYQFDRNRNNEEPKYEKALILAEKNAWNRLLFVEANPNDSARLNIGSELEAIKTITRVKTNFLVETSNATNFQRLLTKITEFKPVILHFSMHGSSDFFVFEDENNNSQLQATDAIQRLINVTETVKCLVLSTCFSANHAKQLSQNGIYVIAINNEISDENAISFSKAFYQVIITEKDIKKAFNTSIATLNTNIGKPVLFENGSEVIF